MRGEIKGYSSPSHTLAVTKGPLTPFAAAQNLGMAGGAHGLDHLEDTLAHPRLADLVVGPHQFQGLALDQRILFLLERRAGLTEALAPTTRRWPASHRRNRTPVRPTPWRTRTAGSSRYGWSRAHISESVET